MLRVRTAGCHNPLVYRHVSLLAALVTVSTACVVGTGTAYDISDPQTLRDLGVPEVTDHLWERPVGDATVKGLTTRADAAELALLGAALSELPGALLDRVRLRHIIRAPDSETTDPHGSTQAFARGPDVYLIDRTFTQSGADRFGLAAVLAHELTHVGQFDQLEAAYIESVIDGSVELDLEGTSELVEDFAGAVGWRKTGSGPSAVWTLSDPRGTTGYGATNPHEDMAESVAFVVTGRAGWLSEDRVAWVEEWLGEPAERLAQGNPWIPAGAEELASADAIYDETAVARLNARNVEPQYWLLEASSPAGEDLAKQIDLELRRRGFGGQMLPIDDGRVARWGGTYVRGDGLHLRAELWDFRMQTGFSRAPDRPLLSYVALW